MLVPIVTLGAACGASPPASHLFAPGTGTCPDPAGCEAPVETTARFEPPDAEHATPSPNLPPPLPKDSTCADVGISVSALEVGNYATPSERAPVAARYEVQCRRDKLDLAERDCVAAAPDQRSMAYCAPRMFPAIPIQLVEPRECADLIAAMRAKDELNAYQNGSVTRARIAALEVSCKQDRWTFELAECARTYSLVSSPAYCTQMAPHALRLKIADRIAKADAPRK